MLPLLVYLFLFFFFTETSPTDIYTLSLHDALPISIFPSTALRCALAAGRAHCWDRTCRRCAVGNTFRIHASLSSAQSGDRKSTRLNSSHTVISYAVFCLKKKKPVTGAHPGPARR